MSSNIKISELNPMTSSVLQEDFIALVDSSSMTTYRTSISQISNGIVPSMNVSTSVHSISSSYASRSLSSSYSDISNVANNVNINGQQYSFPYWKDWYTAGTNGDLADTSPLFVSYSAFAFPGIIGINTGSFDASEYTYDPVFHNYYKIYGWFKQNANTPYGRGGFAAGGINTSYPIIGGFVGTDQDSYVLTASNAVNSGLGVGNPWKIVNTFWSGSANSGSYYTIPDDIVTGLQGHLSQSLNKKWVRIACMSVFGAYGNSSIISMNAAKGEVAYAQHSGDGAHGRVKLVLSTNISGSNVNQHVDMHISDQMLTGQPTVQVVYASYSGTDIMRKFRLSSWYPQLPFPAFTPASSGSRDPVWALDVYIDGLHHLDHIFNLSMYSWGNIRFLKEINVDPPPLRDTASILWPQASSPQQATYLVWPPEPGFYSQLGYDKSLGGVRSGAPNIRNYNIQGLPVTIWPTQNERTRSAWEGLAYGNPYSLNVSGTINATTRYYAQDKAGQDGLFVSYDPKTSTWYSMSYVGGILVESSSASGAPKGAGNEVMPGNSYNISVSYASASTMASTASYVDVGNVNLPGGIPMAFPNLIGAWGLVILPNSGKVQNPSAMFNHNIESISYLGGGNVEDDPAYGTYYTTKPSPSATGSLTYNWGYNYLVTLKNPMPTNKYVVLTGYYTGYEPYGLEAAGGFFNPFSKRTPTQFTISFAGGDHSGPQESNYCGWFMVLSDQ